jgi:hypothetical protein
MYLLMMLATFVSAIYGFNLSVRPDYDRDIMRKKAVSMLYRFNYQVHIASRIITKIEVYNQLDGENYEFGIQPGDEIYASGDAELTYKQGNSEHAFLVQGSDTSEQRSLHLLPEGRVLYDSDEMYSRIYCLPYNAAAKKFYDINDYDGHYHAQATEDFDEEGNPIVDAPPHDGVQNCVSSVDEEGGLTGSCCRKNSHRYLIAFRKMDARWVNRLTNYVNYDFQRAIIEYPFTENIGYVYRQNNQWHFEGRVRLLAAYIDDMRAWAASHQHETNIAKRMFPLKMRNKTTWDLPVGFFTDDFFRVNGEDYCANGCLIKIKQI